MIEREIEVKYMLTEQQFQALKDQFFSTCEVHQQTNHYFDTRTSSIAQQHHAMLRVREKENHCTLTLKAQHPTDEGLIEYHQDNFQWNHSNGTLMVGPGAVATQLHLRHIQVDDLVHRASLVTYRREFHEGDAVVCLDENHYHGIIDYEIECEHHSLSEGNALLHSLFKILPNQPRPSLLNKVQRAFAALSK